MPKQRRWTTQKGGPRQNRFVQLRRQALLQFACSHFAGHEVQVQDLGDCRARLTALVRPHATMTSRGRVQPCDKPQAASSATSRVRVSCFTACTALFTALMSCSSNGFQAWLCGSFSHCWYTTCCLSQTACCTLEVVNGENPRICQNSFTFCIQLEIMFALFLFAFCLHYNYKHDARVCTLNSGFWQLRAGDQAQMRSHSSLRTPIVEINNYQFEVITTVTACRKGRLETCKRLK